MEEKKRILVTRSSMPPLDEFVDEIAPLWESHWLTNMGEKHRLLEDELTRYLDADNVALFVNGHNALECVLEAMDLKGKIITTPFTFSSTTHSIVRVGLEPVMADIKQEDYTLDPDEVEKLIDDDTCAIMPVHVYGNLCDTEAFEAIAQRHGLKLIYDAAHAFGVRKNGISAARYGDASMFSFHATKVFNTIEGGAICFSDSRLKPLLEQWKNFGITGPESVEYVGGNAKMNEICAAMGLCNLRHVDEEIAKRRKVAECYWERLDGVEGVTICYPQPEITPNYAYMPILFDAGAFGASRDEIYKKLASNEIYSRKYFFPLVSDYECYRGKFDSEATPVAKKAADSVLTLPIYADLPIEEVNRICDIVISCGVK